MMQVFHKLQEAWILKVCLSCAVTVAIHEHAQIFTAFVALVFVDLFSKWLSLSRQRLVDHGEQSPNLWQALCGLRAARHDGYIRSDAMRTRFVHKILAHAFARARLCDDCRHRLPCDHRVYIHLGKYARIRSRGSGRIGRSHPQAQRRRDRQEAGD